MADERLEIEVVVSDQASDVLRDLADVVRQTGSSFEGLQTQTVAVDVSMLRCLGGIRSLDRGLRTTVAGLEYFVGKNTQLAKVLTTVDMSMRLVIGPMTMYKGIMALNTEGANKFIMANQGLTLSFIGLAMAIAGTVAIYMALTSSSEKQRSQYALMAGVTWALTGATWALAIAKAVDWDMSTWGIATPIIVASVGAIVAGLSAYAVARYMAEGGVATRPVHAIIGESGPEAVIPLSRMKDVFGTQGGGGGVSIVVHGNVDRGVARRLIQDLDRYQRLEEIRKGRKVVVPG